MEKFAKTETRRGVWEVTEMDTEEEEDTERVLGVEEGWKMMVVVDMVVGEEIGDRKA